MDSQKNLMYRTKCRLKQYISSAGTLRMLFYDLLWCLASDSHLLGTERTIETIIEPFLPKRAFQTRY